MTMKFNFLTTEFDGATAELWHQPPGLGLPGLPQVIRLSQEQINNGVAEFNVTPVNDFAIRVISSGDVLLRSGLKDLSVGTIDSSGDFSVISFPVHPTPTILTPAEVAGLAPSTPFTEEEITITSMTIGITGGTLTATGTADYDTGSFLGDVSVNFSYGFSLEPTTSVTNTDRILDTVTVSTSVSGAAGGLLGWLVNAFVNLILFVIKNTVVNEIESSVQEQIDDAIDDMLSSQGIPDDVTITVRSVNINNVTGMTIDAFALLVTDNLCPATLTSGSLRRRPRKQTHKMRTMRDKVLRNRLQGQAYIRTFESHKRELLQILVRYPHILKNLDTVVELGLQDYSERSPAKGKLSDKAAKRIVELMKEASEVASPELRVVIDNLIPEVKSFTRKPVLQVLEETETKLKQG